MATPSAERKYKKDFKNEGKGKWSCDSSLYIQHLYAAAYELSYSDSYSDRL
jgi:hypothetical protein